MTMTMILLSLLNSVYFQDMRNFSYTLPSVAGLVVHMEERETNILLPRSRYQQVCKALAQSNDHVISLAASFSPNADAHLVCLQLDDGSYQTQAINIHTKPRKGLFFFSNLS